MHRSCVRGDGREVSGVELDLFQGASARAHLRLRTAALVLLMEVRAPKLGAISINRIDMNVVRLVVV
jgi:hypothetical protein